jgi:hypothetical protein
VKDKLSKLVCVGKLDLKTAQREMASDWIKAYKKSAGPALSLVRIQLAQTLYHSHLSATRADLQTSSKRKQSTFVISHNIP